MPDPHPRSLDCVLMVTLKPNSLENKSMQPVMFTCLYKHLYKNMHKIKAQNSVLSYNSMG